jgi:IS4 transposase
MSHKNNIFSQILKLIPRYTFKKIVGEYQGDKGTKKFDSWSHFVAMLYGQITQQRSLRTLEDSFNANQNLHYHLGCTHVKRSTLSDANNKRNAEMFKTIFLNLVNHARSEMRDQADQLVRVVDSTLISLNTTLFKWADRNYRCFGVKAHIVYDPTAEIPTYFEMSTASKSDIEAVKDIPITPGATYLFDRGYYSFEWWATLHQAKCRFISRMKRNSAYKVLEDRSIPDIQDQLIQMTSSKAHKLQNLPLRRISWRDLQSRTCEILTNDLTSTASQLIDLYHLRWDIEVFFKWIKQNLKLKTFFGRSIQAVKTQIWIALIAYLLIHIAKTLTRSMMSGCRLVSVISHNLFGSKSISSLLKPPPPSSSEDPIQYELPI